MELYKEIQSGRWACESGAHHEWRHWIGGEVGSPSGRWVQDRAGNAQLISFKNLYLFQ